MKCHRIIAAVALAVFSVPAFAQLYVTAGLGSAQPKFGSDFDFGVPRTSDTKDTGYQVNLGYRFTPNWAARAVRPRRSSASSMMRCRSVSPYTRATKSRFSRMERSS